MVDGDQGTAPNSPTGKGSKPTSTAGHSITRRNYLVVGTALATLGGCVGMDDDRAEADDRSDATELLPADDDDDTDAMDDSADAVTDSVDDSADAVTEDSEEGDEPPLEVREDFSAYILEIEITYDGPDEAWTQHIYRETDIANDRLYQQFEMMGDEGDPGTFEQYVLEGEAYQILPDGSCNPSDEATIMIHAENPGGFERPHPDSLDTEAEHLTYGGSTTVGWVDESAHLWELDLEPTFEAIDGEMQLYIGVESGYFLGYEGWYRTGAHDDPAEITIAYHQHSFDQDFDIELPEACTAE